MILLGIAGLARSGKDTAANHLAEVLRLERYAFAEPLKTMLKSVFGDHFHVGDRSGICPEAGISYRLLMQTLGTEWGREQVNPQLWVNLVDRHWNEVQYQAKFADTYRRAFETDPPNGMILSDVRFDSEAKWIKDNGGFIIHISRPETERSGAPREGSHASEDGITLSYADVCLINDGDIEDLKIQLTAAYSIMRNRKHGS